MHNSIATLFVGKYNFLLFVVALFFSAARSSAQTVVVNMAPLEGLDITPDNMWGYHIQSTAQKDMIYAVEGKIFFRNNNLSIAYKFNYKVHPGINILDPNTIHPTWTFSSSALRELYMDYKVLPQGTYQYCVSIKPDYTYSEMQQTPAVDDCVYKQSKDLFSITLLEPEDDAKIHEYNPMLSWIATYPFINELTYRIRIAEIKQGQNTENAIVRNNPIYSEKNLIGNSIVYPVYGKPLRKFQPYAWTVDAYYKGLLLGGAQPWKFTIIEDSVMESLPKESSYVDVNMDKGSNIYPAVGDVKIKYSESDFLSNELKISLMKNGKPLKNGELLWQVKRGVNFYTYNLADAKLSHKEKFEILIEYKNAVSETNKQEIKYQYVNPDLVK